MVVLSASPFHPQTLTPISLWKPTRIRYPIVHHLDPSSRSSLLKRFKDWRGDVVREERLTFCLRQAGEEVRWPRNLFLGRWRVERDEINVLAFTNKPMMENTYRGEVGMGKYDAPYVRNPLVPPSESFVSSSAFLSFNFYLRTLLLTVRVASSPLSPYISFTSSPPLLYYLTVHSSCRLPFALFPFSDIILTPLHPGNSQDGALEEGIEFQPNYEDSRWQTLRTL